MTQNKFDVFLGHLQEALNLFHKPLVSTPSPAEQIPEAPLSEADRDLAIRFMRINHTGEICAQALYQGQALGAQTPDLASQLQHAQQEEINHLAWCKTRLTELGGHSSYLDGLWYMGAYCCGALASFHSDALSLGFLAETEKQVGAHLQDQMARLAPTDLKTHAVLSQMYQEETQHAATALEQGAKNLPEPLQQGMHAAATFMKKIVWFI